MEKGGIRRRKYLQWRAPITGWFSGLQRILRGHAMAKGLAKKKSGFGPLGEIHVSAAQCHALENEKPAAKPVTA